MTSQLDLISGSVKSRSVPNRSPFPVAHNSSIENRSSFLAAVNSWIENRSPFLAAVNNWIEKRSPFVAAANSWFENRSPFPVAPNGSIQLKEFANRKSFVRPMLSVVCPILELATFACLTAPAQDPVNEFSSWRCRTPVTVY